MKQGREERQEEGVLRGYFLGELGLSCEGPSDSLEHASELSH